MDDMKTRQDAVGTLPVYTPLVLRYRIQQGQPVALRPRLQCIQHVLPGTH